MAIKNYHGKDITLSFDSRKCIHSRYCVLVHPDVFNPDAKGSWIQPDNGSAEDLAALAQTCPSGAIGYDRHDGAANETAPKINTIRVMENGPLTVRANIEIDGEAAGYRATLCRCGHSKNKPFCDGSHTDAEFSASGEIAPGADDSAEIQGGVLELTLRPDGPVRVNGAVEIISGSGRRVAQLQRTSLCRCGASAKKPYCDGSHKRVGFKSE